MGEKELARMLASGFDFDKEQEALARTLESIGLSGYEARGYLALVAHGYGSAEVIAETAKIPRTSAYKVLQSLCQKGYAISTRGRPSIFKPEPPSKIKTKVFDHLNDTFTKLEMMHEVLSDKGEPQLVYTITTKARVLAKIGELLDTATHAFIVSTPQFYEIRENLAKKLENAVARGIRVTVITEPLQKIPEGVSAVWRKGLIATDIIADAERALIASPDLTACGYTDNPYLAAHLESFLQILMGSPE
ncbi:MAG TPA: helix-turn-helix domain-containing protein [Thermoplasmata archaeon]|nr:helix-turn-helix domain-containing protein [Thermoplasmata archaeon]